MKSLLYAYIIFAALLFLLIATGCASPIAFDGRPSTTIIVQPVPSLPITAPEPLPELRQAPTGVCSVTTYLDIDGTETLTDADEIVTVNDDACEDSDSKDSNSEDKPDKEKHKQKGKDKQEHDKSGGK